MIELIYLENGLYIKKRLIEAFDEYLSNLPDFLITMTFSEFVEKVYAGVLNWCSFDKSEDDSSLSIISYDEELAEDILDSICGSDVDLITDWQMHFKVKYFENINAIRIDYDYNKFHVEMPTPEAYKHSIKLTETRLLTKLARVLDELRSVKIRSER